MTQGPNGVRVLARHALASAFDADEVKLLSRVLRSSLEGRRAGFLPTATRTRRERCSLAHHRDRAVGERDPNRLREDALLYLARTNLKSTGL
jgi:hypothetical protein